MRRILRCGRRWRLAWLLIAPAVAADDGERVGKNLGDMLGGWAKSLYSGSPRWWR